MTSAIPDEQSTKIRRLRRIMSAILYAGVVLTVLSTIAYLLDAESLKDVGILALASSLALYARRQLDRGQLSVAIVVLYVMLLSIIPAGLWGSTGPQKLMALFILVPLMAVLTVLPYSGDRLLRWLMSGAWLSSVAAAFWAHLLRHPGTFSAAIAEYGVFFVEVVVVDSLIFLLLWHFRTGLNGLVDELRASQQRLELEAVERTRALEQAQELQALESEQRTRLEQTAAELERRIAAEQAAQAEALRLRALEAQGRRQLEHVVDTYLGFARLVATGDLTQRLSVDMDGALGELGQGLNTMVAALQQLTGQVQRASAAIGVTAAQLLTSATSQAASAAQQSVAIGQAIATIEEIKLIALQTAEQAQQLSAQSYEALGVAQEGTRAIEQTVVGMERVRQHVSGSVETIVALAAKNQIIGGIIQTVSELADQSNLLALNAAIAAARAGEQGRSFAVVAQHVRELANRSKQSASQIGAILHTIQQATNTAVIASKEGRTSVHEGAQLAEVAGKVIQHMAAEVAEGAQANRHMAAAAQQQTLEMQQISQSMQQIEQATTLTLSGTRQVEQAAQDLNGLAQQLQAAVASYQV